MFNRIQHLQSFQDGIQKIPFQAEGKFRPGEIFRGAVIQKYPGGEVLVSAKGKQFLAHTKLHITEGDRYDFQVKSMGTRIELKVLSGEGLKLQSPIHIWASNRLARDKLANILLELSKAQNLKGLTPGSRQVFRALSQHFPALVYSKPGNDDILWLSRNLMGSGLFWEKRIARHLLGEKSKPWKKLSVSDIKGILLSLAKNLKVEEQDHHSESLAHKIKQALTLIEQNQFQNLSSIREGLGWFWFIPGLAEGGIRKAEVFIKKKETGKKIDFSMFIDFTRLGQMEVSVSIVESLIGVHILVEDGEKAEIVNRNLQLLKTSLENAGMVPGSISCDIKENQASGIIPFSDGEIPARVIHLVI